MRVNMTPVIDFDELEMEFGKDLNEYLFYAIADTLYGYFWLDLSENAVPDLDWLIVKKTQEAMDRSFPVDRNFIQLIENQKELVNALRARGYTEDVLIYVFE